jgi:tetratricopeptide (TPR) repeat protein
VKGLATPEGRRLTLELERDAAGRKHDDAAAKTALLALMKEFPGAPDFADWADSLASSDKAAGAAFKDAVAASVARWTADPKLSDSGWDPGDLYWSQADFLDEIGDAAASKAAWSMAADAYKAQAARSPLAVPRAANFGVAEALMHAGRTAEAKALYERLLKAYPEEFTFNYDYASVLKSQGDAAAAYPYAVQAEAASYGDNWLRAVRLKGELELALGRKTEAARTVDAALSRAVPAAPGVRTGRYLDALKSLRAKIDGKKS